MQNLPWFRLSSVAAADVGLINHNRAKFAESGDADWLFIARIKSNHGDTKIKHFATSGTGTFY
jgi:hypothetical protein